MTYTAKTFTLPPMEGLSEKQIKVHLALYEGYVKHVNLIMSMSKMYGKTDDEGGKYSLAEFRRRFAFEFNAAVVLADEILRQGQPQPMTIGTA